MTEKRKKEYDARLKRVTDAIRLTPPDRVPVAPLTGHFYFTNRAGLTKKEAMYDHTRRFAAWETITREINPDMAVPGLIVPPGPPMDILDVKQFKWPGNQLEDDTHFQYVEEEYLQAEEYDDFLQNPADFTVRTLWPRAAGLLEPLGLFPPLHLLPDSLSLTFQLGVFCSLPMFSDMLEKLQDLGTEMKKYLKANAAYNRQMKEAGYPVAFQSFAMAPLDYVGDLLRGMRGYMLDMFRNPDKLLAATELFTEMAIAAAIQTARMSKNPRVFIPLHKGSAGFMSDEQFRKFYWPGLQRLLVSLIEADLTPCVFFEGDYTPRLEYLAELPAGKIGAHFDVVDRQKAKKITGNTLCFWGNVPPQLLTTGTPEQVQDDVKELIDTFADNGGLIVDCSVGIPDEAKPENIEAMVGTVFDYGKN